MFKEVAINAYLNKLKEEEEQRKERAMARGLEAVKAISELFGVDAEQRDDVAVIPGIEELEFKIGERSRISGVHSIDVLTMCPRCNTKVIVWRDICQLEDLGYILYTMDHDERIPNHYCPLENASGESSKQDTVQELINALSAYINECIDLRTGQVY